uniref:Non-specific serine/threonine protein kinase n=1 Tax=Hydatigena taeniaeformis TaxID=6205 RepID=A0A0R3WMR7_HYDTA
LNTWLRTVDLAIDCLNQLLSLDFSNPASTVAIDETARLLPDSRLPNYLSFALNEFMLTLRIYTDSFPNMQTDPDVTQDFERWLRRFFYLLSTPILEECLKRLPHSLQFLIYSLRFQSIKVAAVYAPEILEPPKALTEADGHPLPLILQHLGMAIEALAPSFSLLSATELRSFQTDLAPLVMLILDVLRTANEYFVCGLGKVSMTESPSLWLVNNVASVQRKVEKLLPFQLNSLLSTDLSQLGASSARRKVTSGDLCYRLLHSYLSPLDVRLIISFRLDMIRVKVLSKQLVNKHHSDQFVTTVSEQLRISLSWLQNHLSICGGCGDADYNDPQSKHEDYKLIICIVTHLIVVQGTQKDLLSEFGIQNILREALVLRRVVNLLYDYIDKDVTEENSESLSIELLPSLLPLARALHSLCISLLSKIYKPFTKSSTRRVRSRTGGGIDVLCAALQLPDIEENLDPRRNLLRWTRIVQSQLIGIENYLKRSLHQNRELGLDQNMATWKTEGIGVASPSGAGGRQTAPRIGFTEWC